MARLLDLGGLFDSYNTHELPDAIALFAGWNAVGQDIRSAIDTFESSTPPKSLVGRQYELFADAQ